MGERVLEFEAGGGGRAVVGAYDAASDRWAFSFDSPFWKAVRHAHDLGFRGAGRRVAIIDSGCDLSIPRLRRCVDLVKSFAGRETGKDPLGHGTAVALLISEVASACRLDVYQVAADGTPIERAIIDALKTASESAAEVINISIAAVYPFQFTDEHLTSAIAEGQGSLKKYAQETPPCGLCAAAENAIARGKLVFAAAGNRPDTISCPARASGVAAAGFHGMRDKVTSTDDGGLAHSAFAEEPAGPQTLLVELTLREMDGVLGTSFACPLFSGVGAMGLSHTELSGYIAAKSAAGWAQLGQGLMRSSPSPPNPDMVRKVSRWFINAQSKLPHVHCAYQRKVNAAIAPSDPSQCPFCGIFAEPILVNHGLWLLETEETESGRSLLEAARAAAPWSAEAVACLGAATRELGDIPGAIASYEEALRLRPDFVVYKSELKRLRKWLRVGGTRRSRL